MDGIISKMNEVTDHSNIIKMQTDAKIQKADARIKRVIAEASDLGYEIKPPTSLNDVEKDVSI